MMLSSETPLFSPPVMETTVDKLTATQNRGMATIWTNTTKLHETKKSAPEVNISLFITYQVDIVENPKTIHIYKSNILNK